MKSPKSTQFFQDWKRENSYEEKDHLKHKLKDKVSQNKTCVKDANNPKRKGKGDSVSDRLFFLYSCTC